MKKSGMVVLALFCWVFPLLAQTDLAVGLTASTTSPVLGGRLSLTATIQNLGPSNVSNILVSYRSPAHCVVISSETRLGVYSPTLGVWTAGSLAAGQSASLIIHLNTTRIGRTEHQLGDLRLMGTDTNPSNNTAVQVVEVLAPATPLFSQSAPSFSFYPMQNKVTVGGKSIFLSPEAYKVLAYLHHNQGRAFSASELISNALGGIAPALGFEAVMRELSANKTLNKHLRYKKATEAWLFKG